MRHFWKLILVLAGCIGCAGEGEKSQWSEFWKDLRGDNMEMHGYSEPKPPSRD